jgi:hypothetical protein
MYWLRYGSSKWALEHYLSSLLRVNPARLQALRKRRARHRLAVALRAVPHPVVIALDDIDRMRPEHVRQGFDAVAQTSGLPRLGYLLSFDRWSRSCQRAFLTDVSVSFG